MKYPKNSITLVNERFHFEPGIYQQLLRDFSQKDVETEIIKAETWLKFNPPKKDYRRFLCNWLLNAKNKQLKFNEHPGGERVSSNSGTSSIQDVLLRMTK